MVLTSDLLYVVLFALLVIGFGNAVIQLLSVAGNLRITQRYIHRFDRYLNSEGSDHALYTWLMENSQPMQWRLGQGGILEFYRPSFANYALKNLPVLINLLPDLRQSFMGGFSAQHSANIAAVIEDALLRYLGVVRFQRKRALLALFNPLEWFRLGIGIILGLPVSVLRWAGLLSDQSAAKVIQHRLFRAFASVVTVIGLIASIIGMTVDAERFLELIARFVTLSP